MLEIASHIISELGEGPVWDDKLKMLYWIDIKKGQIHNLEPKSSRMNTISLGKMIGSVAFCKSNHLLVAKEDGVAIINQQGDFVLDVGLPPHSISKFRFNDGKCDALGRFWVGGMSDDERGGVGCLYCIDRDFRFKKVLDGLTIPNGMEWNEDQTKFYFIDTPTFNVQVYQFDLTLGQLSSQRIAFTIPKEDGYPDGMTIDEDGMLWIAHFGGSQVTRWNPDKGTKIFSIKLPVSNVTSCTFGGEGLDDLYITTARKGLTSEQLKNEPLAGALFVLRACGTKGKPVNRFSI